MVFTPAGYVTHSEGKRYIEVDKTNNGVNNMVIF